LKISSFAVHRPVTMLMIICCVTVLGLIAMIRLPINLRPEVTYPVLSVSAYWSSASPEEVQKAVTIPLEDILSTTSRLDEITSWSYRSRSRITLRFDQGTNMDLVAMEVRDKIDQVMKQLPEDLRRLYIQRYEENDEAIIGFHVSWDGPKYELEDLIWNVIYHRLRRVDGVADVDIHGLERKEVMVELDQNLLKAHNVDIFDLSRNIGANNRNVSSGHVRSGGRKYAVRAIGEYRSVPEIATTAIAGTGLTLEDLGEVRYDVPYRKWWNRLNGSESNGIHVYKSSTANMLEMANRVITVLDDLQQEPGMEPLSINIYRDLSQDIIRSLMGLIKAGLLGMIFACIVLYGFLRKVRTTLVIIMAIPLSIISTFLFMYLSREILDSTVSINLVSLSGLMVSVGMLLDNGVVVLENIFRHRQQHHDDPRTAAITGSAEVAMPVVAATVTTLIVFVPLFFVGSELMSSSMKDFGIVVCVALVASLCIAFTLIPLLASRMFHQVRTEQLTSLATLSRYYTRIIRYSLRNRGLTVACALIIVALSGWLFTKVERELAPREPSRFLSLRVEHPSRFTDVELIELFDAIDEALLPNRDALDIDRVTTSFGRPYSSSGSRSRSSSSLRIGLKDLEDSRNPDTVDAIEKVMAVLPERPGVTYRRNRSRSYSGGEHTVELELTGHDVGILALYAEEVKLRLGDITGVLNIETSLEAGREEVSLRVHREKAQKYGLSSRQIAQTLASALGTRPASYYKTDRGERRITVRLRDEDRVALSELENMVLQNNQGEMVTLGTVAEHELQRGPLTIERENRRTVVEIWLTTREPGRRWLQEEIFVRLQDMKMPIGYHWDLGRSFHQQEEMEQDTLFAALLALTLIYMILAALFESFIHPLTILLSVPFAMIGVFLMFMATGITLNSMSYLGIIILMGIVVNNGIILISYLLTLRQDGVEREEAIVQACTTRLRPILMTASTTILGISPMVMPLLLPTIFPRVGGMSGTYGPIASAVMGGLLTSTLLTLIITPTLYSLMDDLWDWLHRVCRALVRS